jgi:hypothetical protein
MGIARKKAARKAGTGIRVPSQTSRVAERGQRSEAEKCMGFAERDDVAMAFNSIIGGSIFWGCAAFHCVNS